VAIDFDEISATNEVPASLTEVATSGPTGAAAKRVLLLGQRLSTGAIAADTVFRVLGETTGDAKAGAGSYLAEMCRAYKRIDKSSVVDAIGIDNGSGTAATGSIAIASGTATTAGSLDFMIGGRRYSVAVEVGDDNDTDYLTALKAAIDADTRRTVTTSSITSSTTLPLTARCKGLAGNYIDIRQVSGDIGGFTVTITAMSGGATSLTLTGALAAAAATHYDTIVCGFNDDTALDTIDTEMARRFAGGVEMRGTAFVATTLSLADSLTWSASRNSKHMCPTEAGASPTPFWIWAAQVAARDTLAYANDPGLPRKGLTLPDCIAPDIEDRFEFSERNQLLAAGMSTYDVAIDGTVAIERLVTAYKTDAQGQADKKFHDLTTMRIIHDYSARWKAKTSILETYKLVDDDTPLRPGIRAITQSGGKAMMDTFYEDYAGTGNVQDVTNFVANSRCERNANDRTRLDFYHPMRVGDIVVTVATRLEVQ
jgi:phage tail sheath gpL-like